MPFKFSLQKILDLRIQREDEAKQKLAQAKFEYQQQAKLVDSIKSELEKCLTKILTDKNISQAEFWLWTEYEKGLKDDLLAAEQQLQLLGQKVNRLRQELINKSKERKLLEKFKQKQAEKYEYEQRQKEQKEFDEISVLRFQRSTH
jgi:flagellar FliJ protein